MNLLKAITSNGRTKILERKNEMSTYPVEYRILEEEIVTLKTKITRLEKQRDVLLTTIQNALVSLAVIQMPTMRENIGDATTNNELLKIMADSFREALAGK